MPQAVEAYALGRLPETDDELWWLVKVMWGVEIPRVAVCPGHVAPFTAFADVIFGRCETAIIVASRGFGGKSMLLSILGLTACVLFGVGVTLIGASKQQTERIHDAMRRGWEHPYAPRGLIIGEPTTTRTRMSNGGDIIALAGSEASVRGPHPNITIGDEIDAFPGDCSGPSGNQLLTSALGQPMFAKGRAPQAVLSSTWHLPNGPMSWLMDRVAGKHEDSLVGDRAPFQATIYEWCMKESMQPHGWLDPEDVERARRRVPPHMWQVEYELQRPDDHQRLILPEPLEAMFDASLGACPGELGTYYEFAAPKAGALYSHGADWAKAVDETVVVTFRVDCHPMQVVAFERINRKPWPEMIELLNERMARYSGPSSHDATGLGSVVADYLRGDPNQVEGVIMVGARRNALFSEYLAAIDAGQIQSPRIEAVYREHLGATRRDLFGSGHPPDSVVSFALGYHAAARAGRDLGISI